MDLVQVLALFVDNRDVTATQQFVANRKNENKGNVAGVYKASRGRSSIYEV
jgi:hypothetical protein